MRPGALYSCESSKPSPSAAFTLLKGIIGTLLAHRHRESLTQRAGAREQDSTHGGQAGVSSDILRSSAERWNSSDREKEAVEVERGHGWKDMPGLASAAGWAACGPLGLNCH